MKSKKKLLTTIGVLTFVTPALALSTISCGSNPPNTNKTNKTNKTKKPVVETVPFKTPRQKHIEALKNIITKLKALDTTTKTNISPLSLQDKLIYSKDLQKITTELGINNTIKLPKYKEDGNIEITSIDWDPIYDNNSKLKIFKSNNQNVAAVKVTMQLELVYYREDDKIYSHYKESFDWIIKGFKPINKEDLTIKDWKIAYPDQVKYLYNIPSNDIKNLETSQERLNQLFRIFIDKDDLYQTFSLQMTPIRNPVERALFYNLQDLYNDLHENQTVLTYGAFDSKAINTWEIKKLPKHLWIPDDVIPVGVNMFASSEIPSKFQFPKSMNWIVYCMFWGSKFSDNFKIPSTITKIGWRAFSDVNFNFNFKLPSSIKSIYPQAFIRSGLPTGFKIPDGVKFAVTKHGYNPFDKSSEIPNAHWEPQDKDGYPLPGSVLKAGN